MNTKYKILNSNSQRGAAIITAVMFFVFISITFALGLSTPIVREYINARDFEKSKGAYYLAEAGHEDVLYRFKRSKQVSATSETLTLNGNTAVTRINTVGSSNKTLSTVGDIAQNTRRVKSAISTGTGASFSFGVQAGNGGIFMENSSSITGNVYSNGIVQGSGSNSITGSVVSATSTGGVTGVSSGGSVYSHTIGNSVIGGNAYYFSTSTFTSTTVSGTKFPGSVDQATTTLPISDAQITQFEADAATGGTPSSPCIINSPTTWSARKVTCSKLEIKDTLTISGWIWVTGNVEIENQGRIVLDSSLGALSAGIIANNTADRIASSMIIIKNSATFSGSGTAGSFVFLISQNNSAETGGSNKAIELQNSASGDILLYAAHGEISIANNTALKEVTAYRVRLKNSANVTYTSGLSNVLFVGSPSGAWNINDWKEGQ